MLRLRLNPTIRLLAAVGLCVASHVHAAEDLPNWRLFTSRDGLAESHVAAVTLSPRGAIWLRHGDGAAATRLDGYDVRTFPTPGEGKSPVYESRSGQIWCLATEGLQEFTGGRWIVYRIPEISAENARSLRRRVHPIPIVPAERDHVLFLLSDGLFRFDVATTQAQLLKRSFDLGLGSFLDMIETRDGSLVISAESGLIRLSGPLRRLSPQSVAVTSLPPADWHVSGLDRPCEDDDGGMVVTGVVGMTNRVIARFDGASWELITPGVSRLRQGWRGLDGGYWALSRDRLVRMQRGQTREVLQAGTLAGYHNEAAASTNDTFWVATQEGALLHTPRPWRTPYPQDLAGMPATALHQASDSWIWFLAPDGLRAIREQESRRFPWPEELESGLQPADRLLPLSNGSWLVGIGERLMTFDVTRASFQDLPGNTQGRPVRLLGSTRDGAAIVLCQAPSATNGSLARFDGRRWQSISDWNPDGPLGADLVFSAEAANLDVWVGTGSGVGFIREGKLQSFGPAQGYTGGRTTCWLELGEGRVWCGGVDSIFEFDGRAWSLVRSGFDRVHGLMKATDGSVWVASGNGLHRFFRDSWVSASVEEGLPSMAVLSVMEDRRGRVWAGTPFGLSRYHARTDTDPPRTSATQVGGEPGVAREGTIRFSFSGVDKWHATLPARLLFSHRLDAGTWSAFSIETSIAFKDLSPGVHQIQVRAMDRDWNVDPNPVILDFKSVVPWYRDPTTSSIALVATAIICLLGWLAINRHLRLLRSHAEIERIVEERTQALNRANQELLHSQKMKALGTLAAGVAHDFNQILSIIKGSAQIIEGNLDNPDKIRTRTQRIQTVVEQGTGIVKAMLGLSRQDPGDPATSDVNHIVREVVRLLGDRFLDGVTVRLDLQKPLPPVRASGDLVQQMLLNLAVNAADAMNGHGEILLATNLIHSLPPGLVLEPSPAPGYVSISVVDHGSGVPPELLPRIFEPFFTTKAFSTKRGTGLGLSMVYEFAKEIGCGLRVESEPGKGSTFAIILPAPR
jgi:signal transduction histidine kinase/ligand-binding sensor domain-containing protein